MTIAGNAQGLAIGSKAENFSLPDTNGATKSMTELKGEKGTIVVFLSSQCPVVKAYNERLSKVYDDYKAKGVNFIGINSNSTESLAAIKSHAEEHYRFPVLIDTGNVIADKLKASATPEILFFDKDGKLAYHGAIDNDRQGDNVTSNYLRDAMNEYLAGKTVTKAVTAAFGCSIKRVGD